MCVCVHISNCRFPYPSKPRKKFWGANKGKRIGKDANNNMVKQDAGAGAGADDDDGDGGDGGDCQTDEESQETSTEV